MKWIKRFANRKEIRRIQECVNNTLACNRYLVKRMVDKYLPLHASENAVSYAAANLLSNEPSISQMPTSELEDAILQFDEMADIIEKNEENWKDYKAASEKCNQLNDELKKLGD